MPKRLGAANPQIPNRNPRRRTRASDRGESLPCATTLNVTQPVPGSTIAQAAASLDARDENLPQLHFSVPQWYRDKWTLISERFKSTARRKTGMRSLRTVNVGWFCFKFECEKCVVMNCSSLTLGFMWDNVISLDVRLRGRRTRSEVSLTILIHFKNYLCLVFLLKYIFSFSFIWAETCFSSILM